MNMNRTYVPKSPNAEEFRSGNKILERFGQVV